MTPARAPASSSHRHDDGFTLMELLVAMAITLGLMVALFAVAQPAQGLFDSQPELADMQQRLRVGVDVLAHALLMADAPVMPYRVGQRQSDPERGVFFRPDTISVLSVPWDGAAVESHTYSLRSVQAAGEFQLRHYDGASTDLPVLDHVVQLNFDYFGADRVRFDPARLEDGPWYPDATDSHRFDTDLLNIRLVRVTLRVQAASAALRGPAGLLFVHGGTAVSRERYVPDREIRFDVTPRNLDHE